MALTEKQKYELKKLVKNLNQYRRTHTELVSVYIPQGYDINKIINHLFQEKGTASNIKSASTRNNVQVALEKMTQHLRLFKKTPDHGLAVFSGNVAQREGQQDFQVFSIEPPVPLKTRIYRCDKSFVTDLLEEMMEVKEVYGFIVVDRRDADIALLKGKTIIPLLKTHSHVPGKQRAGGQCLAKDTNVLVHNFNEKVSVPISEFQLGNNVLTYDFENNELSNTSCLDYWTKKTDKLLIIKTEKNEIKASRNHTFFVEDNEVKEVQAKHLKVGDNLLRINNEYKKEKITIVSIEEKEGDFELIDISVKNQNFIANGLIVHNSAPRFARLRMGAIKDHYKKVADYVKEQFLGKKELKGIIVGGPGPSKHDFINEGYLSQELKNKVIAIKDLSYTGEFGLQELLEKSQDVLAKEEVMAEKKIMGEFFNLLAKKPAMVSYGKDEVMKNIKMGAVDKLLLSEILDDETIELFEAEAKKLKTSVHIISTETREGIQLRDIGKIAAILRYEVNFG